MKADPHTEAEAGCPGDRRTVSLQSKIGHRKSKIVPAPDPQSKIPKRLYVLTSRGLAAVLANLEKARVAPKALAYRPTVRRLLASHANLVKALRAKQGRSANGQGPIAEESS